MNLKEKIIRSKIARLQPRGETTLIRRLEEELSRPDPANLAAEPSQEVKIAPPAPKPLRPLTEADVDDFRALKAEVHIRSKKHGDIYLVPERTGAPRFEILPEEMRQLSLAADKFNGRIVEVRRDVPA
jgi:hypothetical protein